MDNYQLARDRSRREIRSPVRFGFSDFVAHVLGSAQEIKDIEPSSYLEAIASKDSNKWIHAMKEELKSLAKNQT